MGLDIRPGGARWSYHGFMSFRRKLARLEGIDLDEMEGFTANGKSWFTSSSGNPITVLQPLLAHSDCDGYLDFHECEEMLTRLRAIEASWPTEDDEFGYDRDQLRALIAGMEHSAEHGCAVVFS